MLCSQATQKTNSREYGKAEINLCSEPETQPPAWAKMSDSHWDDLEGKTSKAPEAEGGLQDEEACLENGLFHLVLGIFPDMGLNGCRPPDQEIRSHKETVYVEMGSNPDWPCTIFHLG